MQSRPQPVQGDDAAQPQVNPAGLRILLTSAGGESSAENGLKPLETSAPSPAPRLSKAALGSLFAADALLCALAYRIVRAQAGPVGWIGWALAAAAIVFGAWLSLLALQLARDRKPPLPNGSGKFTAGD